MRVYPRVCGGNGRLIFYARCVRGLSPRVRGKLDYATVAPTPTGSIPACAGETARLGVVVYRPAVYPRVCGGNAFAPIP